MAGGGGEGVVTAAEVEEEEAGPLEALTILASDFSA